MTLEQNIQKADRYFAHCKAHGFLPKGFMALAQKSIDMNDFRVLELHYFYVEFECRQSEACTLGDYLISRAAAKRAMIKASENAEYFMMVNA